ENALALETIESAVFSLSLDNFSPGTKEAAARTLLHGDTGNRWFDKSIQFIVCANGVAGLNFEHSHLDGSPMARLVRFVTGKEPEPSVVTAHFSPSIRNLPLHISTELRKTITDADKATRRSDSNTLMRHLEFKSFGKEDIKRRGISPDAFIQIALQLAQHRTWGKIYSVFESVMLRSFLHGRTEAMRPLSIESKAFVTSMTDPGASDETREKLLRLAGEKHVKRIKRCMAGEGVEGHLHALLLLWKETGETTPPALYLDEGWKRLIYTVSTTSTTRVDGLALGGYGPAVNDGFSFRFLKKPDFLGFFVCCRSELGDDLERFTDHLFGSLKDMLKLL
ncbi:MAG: choline/carnitine O-acyltransferase, partial [Synergistota bacterium]|nr:choline/carnitine O-acyltransferase [Synergistota bacterium]